MKSLRFIFLLLLLTASVSPAAAADWVLVANPKAGITRLSREEVINIYLGRYRRFASGITADPIDQPAHSALRVRFYRQLVDKSQSEINAYWARLVFSGKTQPPPASCLIVSVRYSWFRAKPGLWPMWSVIKWIHG